MVRRYRTASRFTWTHVRGRVSKMSEEVFFIAACADGHLNDAFLTIDEAIDFANKKGMTEVWRVLSDGPNKTFDEDRAVTVWTAIKVDEFIDDPFNKEY